MQSQPKNKLNNIVIALLSLSLGIIATLGITQAWNESPRKTKAKAKTKPKGEPVFTWAVSEHTLEWLDDAEAVDLDAGMHALAPNVCHLLREYDPRQAAMMEPGRKSNWKWLSSTNEGVKQELTDLVWYTVDNWQDLLNADSVLVGV